MSCKQSTNTCGGASVDRPRSHQLLAWLNQPCIRRICIFTDLCTSIPSQGHSIQSIELRRGRHILWEDHPGDQFGGRLCCLTDGYSKPTLARPSLHRLPGKKFSPSAGTCMTAGSDACKPCHRSKGTQKSVAGSITQSRKSAQAVDACH